MRKQDRIRSPPARSGSVWAREFTAALAAETGLRIEVDAFERIASWSPRLRERVPSSVVTIVKASSAAAGFSVAEWVKMGQRNSDLLVLKAEAAERRMRYFGKLLGLSSNEVKKRVRRCPRLLCLSETIMAKRMAGLCRALGFSEGDWRRYFIRFPDIFIYDVATLRKRVKGQRTALNLTSEQYRAALMRELRLPSRSVGGIEGMLHGMTEHWGFERKKAQELLAASPKLMVSGTFVNMDNNLSLLARGLKVEKEEVVAAFRLFTPLAHQNPKRLVAVVKAAAVLFGIELDAMAKAMLRAPSLMARRQTDSGKRMRFVIRIARALGADLTAEEVLRKFPTALTYGSDRLLQRYAMARLGLWGKNWAMLLTLRDVAAREKLAAHFTAHEDRRGMEAALQRRGLI